MAFVGEIIKLSTTFCKLYMALELGNNNLIDEKNTSIGLSCFHNHTKPFYKMSAYVHISNDVAWHF